MSEQQFQEYPKAMTHPHYKRATMTQIDGKDPNSGKIFHDVQGTPDRFAPVLVNDRDQEEAHLAMGYEPAGQMDEAAFARGVAAPIPPDYQPEAYPKWVGGVLCETEADEREARQASGMEELPQALEPTPAAPVETRSAAEIELEELKLKMAGMQQALDAATSPKPLPPPVDITGPYVAPVMAQDAPKAPVRAKAKAKPVKRPTRPRRAA